LPLPHAARAGLHSKTQVWEVGRPSSELPAITDTVFGKTTGLALAAGAMVAVAHYE
jgi:hypothetical protein